MDGFSAILVAVPLILPFAARFTLGPFHMAMIFLLNLEIAYCCPPLGLNLFISSFRFSRPVVSLYRVVLPFAGILTLALIMVSYIPAISDVTIRGDIARARKIADDTHSAPREAWMLECVQEDRTNPLPCTPEDKAKWPGGQAADTTDPTTPTPVAGGADGGEGSEEDELLKQMEGKPGGAAGADTGIESEDDLLKEMEGAGKAKDAGAAPAPTKPPPAPETANEDDLLKMMSGKKDGG